MLFVVCKMTLQLRPLAYRYQTPDTYQVIYNIYIHIYLWYVLSFAAPPVIPGN